ncbi:MAG: hypothetical protein Q8936_01695 [Bacillota bacterium]|nr:hypothetical protein [Bacillota bacterium]
MADEWTQIDGLASLENNFNRIIKDLGEVNTKAFTDNVLDLLGKSVELAPVDTGDLRGSGSANIQGVQIAKGNKEGNISVTGTVHDDTVLAGTVGFNEPYAVRQHEHTEYKHPQGGESKYLEQPFRQNINKYIDHIADANRRHLE